MTREDAIKILKRELGVSIDIKVFPEVLIAFNMAIEALEQEPKIRWFPVNERLPEEDERVLISVNGNRGKRVRSATYLGGNSKSFWSDTGEFWDLNKDEKNLIAWMPLPEPYELGD